MTKTVTDKFGKELKVGDELINVWGNKIVVIREIDLSHEVIFGEYYMFDEGYKTWKLYSMHGALSFESAIKSWRYTEPDKIFLITV